MYAHGVELVLVVDFVLLCGGIENLQLWVLHAAIGIHQLVDHVLRDDGVVGQVYHVGVFHATDRLSSNAHIYLGYVCFQRSFKFRDYVG